MSVNQTALLKCGKFLTAAMVVLLFCVPASAAPELTDDERRALELRVELSRMTGADDADAREAVCLSIIQDCGGTEEAEAAYWRLADIYLDAFDEPQEQKARDVLKRFIERCPNSRWVTHARLRLLELGGDKKEIGTLRSALQKDDSVPKSLRAGLGGK